MSQTFEQVENRKMAPLLGVIALFAVGLGVLLLAPMDLSPREWTLFGVAVLIMFGGIAIGAYETFSCVVGTETLLANGEQIPLSEITSITRDRALNGMGMGPSPHRLLIKYGRMKQARVSPKDRERFLDALAEAGVGPAATFREELSARSSLKSGR